jgi:hypothetical protein
MREGGMLGHCKAGLLTPYTNPPPGGCGYRS